MNFRNFFAALLLTLLPSLAFAQFGPVSGSETTGDGVSLFCVGSVCGMGYSVGTTKTTAFSVGASDMGKLVPVNISGGGTITLPSSGAFTSFFANRQSVCLQNIGTAADPISNLTAGTMYPTTTVLLPDQTLCIVSDGSALYADTKVLRAPTRRASSPTVTTGDMDGTLWITSGGVTIPAVSAGLFDNKQTLFIVNYGGSDATVTNSSGQSIATGAGCAGVIPAGGFWQLQPNAAGSTFTFECAQGVSVSIGSGGGGSFAGVSGTSALGTSAISSATCATVVSTTATGTTTSDTIAWGFNGDPTAVTGYVPLTAGMLTVVAYPSADHANFKVCNDTGGSITPGAITLNWRVLPASAVVASGTSVLGTSAISSAACATVVTTSASGTATTDVVWWGFNSDPTSTTGYVPATAGMLSIIAYPSSNNVNFKVCNDTSSSITPGARTLNWKVIH